MFDVIKRLFMKRGAAVEEVSLQVIQALCDHQRPMLRTEDLERLHNTHSELQKDLEATRNEARRISDQLSSELERARMRVAIISDSLMDPLLCVDAEGIIVSSNQTVERILGYTAADLREKPVSQLLETQLPLEHCAAAYMKWVASHKPAHMSECRDLYRDFIKSPDGSMLNRTMRVEVKTRNGSLLPAELYLNIFNVESEEVSSTLFLLIFRDVTEHEAAVSEAEKMRRMHTSLISTIPNPVFQKDDQLRFSASNQAFEQFVRMQQSEIIGCTNQEVFPQDVAVALDSVEKGLQDGSLTGRQVVKTHIYTPRMDIQRDVMLYCAAVHTNSGVFRGLVSTFVDLSELALTQKLKDTLIANIPAPVYYLDSALKYVACNDRYLALVGRDRTEVIGNTREAVLTCGPGTLLEFYRHKDFEAVTSGVGSQVYETQVCNSHTGDMRDIILYRSIMRDANGGFEGIIAIVTDVSEIRSVQRFHQRIFESSPLPTFYKDANLTYVTCNDLYARWFAVDKAVFPGRTREQVVSHVISTLGQDPVKSARLAEAQPHIQNLITAHKQNDEKLKASTSSCVSVFELPTWSFELNELRNVVFYTYALVGPKGFEGLICNMVDVTSLRRAEQFKVDVLSSIPVPACLCSEAGVVEACNFAFLGLVELGSESAVVGLRMESSELRVLFNPDTTPVTYINNTTNYRVVVKGVAYNVLKTPLSNTDQTAYLFIELETLP